MKRWQCPSSQTINELTVRYTFIYLPAWEQILHLDQMGEIWLKQRSTVLRSHFPHSNYYFLWKSQLCSKAVNEWNFSSKADNPTAWLWMENCMSFRLPPQLSTHDDFLTFTSGTLKLVCDLNRILTFIPWRLLWLLLFHMLSRKIMQNSHLFFSFSFCFFFFSPHCCRAWIHDALTLSLTVQMDRGGLRTVYCRLTFVVVGIELLHRVHIFMLEERRRALVPQRLAKVKKGREGISVKEGPFLFFFWLAQNASCGVAISFTILSSWCRCCVFHLSTLNYLKETCHNQEHELFL